jgi:hypothetical protein
MEDATKGYRVVPDAGTPVPSPRGTEVANEGKASSNKWAKRKGNVADEGVKESE